MSILIKGMEMPKNCDSCPCYYETEGAWRNECEVLQREHYITDERPDWCPLVPVPPHGRLIDADAYKAEMKKRQDNCAEWRDNAKADGDMEIYHRADGALSVFCEAKLTLDKMPTIIPADKDGAEC